MATYLVVNGTASALTDINSGNDDCPAYGTVEAVLTDGELGTLLGTAGVIAMKSASTKAQKRMARKVLGVGRNPGVG